MYIVFYFQENMLHALILTTLIQMSDNNMILIGHYSHQDLYDLFEVDLFFSDRY